MMTVMSAVAICILVAVAVCQEAEAEVEGKKGARRTSDEEWDCQDSSDGRDKRRRILCLLLTRRDVEGHGRTSAETTTTTTTENDLPEIIGIHIATSPGLTTEGSNLLEKEKETSVEKEEKEEEEEEEKKEEKKKEEKEGWYVPKWRMDCYNSSLVDRMRYQGSSLGEMPNDHERLLTCFHLVSREQLEDLYVPTSRLDCWNDSLVDRMRYRGHRLADIQGRYRRRVKCFALVREKAITTPRPWTFPTQRPPRTTTTSRYSKPTATSPRGTVLYSFLTVATVFLIVAGMCAAKAKRWSRAEAEAVATAVSVEAGDGTRRRENQARILLDRRQQTNRRWTRPEYAYPDLGWFGGHNLRVPERESDIPSYEEAVKQPPTPTASSLGPPPPGYEEAVSDDTHRQD